MATLWSRQSVLARNVTGTQSVLLMTGAARTRANHRSAIPAYSWATILCHESTAKRYVAIEALA